MHSTEAKYALFVLIVLLQVSQTAFCVTLALSSGYDFSLRAEDFDVFSLRNKAVVQIDSHILEERFENTTMFAWHIAHLINETVALEPGESSCCTLIGNKAHWIDRDMPVRVYSSDSLVNKIRTAADKWQQASGGIDLLGVIQESNKVLTDGEAALSRSQNINTIGYAQIDWPGEGTPLAVTTVFFESSLQNHIVHYDIRMNANVANIGDAVHNPQNYDELSLVVHEFGHVCGLNDLYSSQCTDSLMYYAMGRGDVTGRVVDNTARSCVRYLYQNLPLEGEIATSSATRLRPFSCLWW